jgi:hypothetical protein
LSFRGLLATLVGRELKARYRGSVLGYFWSLVNPLLLLAVYTFVFSFVFRPRIGGTEPYALFLMTGLFPWIWVSGSLLEGTQSLTANAGLIRKAVFPAQVLPLVPVVSNLVHFLLAVPILAGALVVGRMMGFEVGGWSALLLPAIIALELPVIGPRVACHWRFRHGFCRPQRSLQGHPGHRQQSGAPVVLSDSDYLSPGVDSIPGAAPGGGLVESLYTVYPVLSGCAVSRICPLVGALVADARLGRGGLVGGDLALRQIE